MTGRSSIETGELVTVRVERSCVEALLHMLEKEHFAYHEDGLRAARAFDALEAALRRAERAVARGGEAAPGESQ